MREVSAVQGDGVLCPGRGERGPGGQAEMGMDHVEAVAHVPAAELPRGSRISPRIPGLEREHVNVKLGNPGERLDLISYEAAKCRVPGGRVRVGDEQRAHRLGESI